MLELRDPKNRPAGQTLQDGLQGLGYDRGQAEVLARQSKDQLRAHLNTMGEARRKERENLENLKQRAGAGVKPHSSLTRAAITAA